MFLLNRFTAIPLLLLAAGTPVTQERSADVKTVTQIMIPPGPRNSVARGQLPGRFKIDPIVTTDSADCVIPFTRVGNLIVIKGRVNDVEGNFILDTGGPQNPAQHPPSFFFSLFSLLFFCSS